jgi:hypothetical protein
VRLPIVEVDDAERAVVRDALAAHGLLRETSASGAVASALRETG